MPPKDSLNLSCVSHNGVAVGAPVDEEKAEEGLNSGNGARLWWMGARVGGGRGEGEGGRRNRERCVEMCVCGMRVDEET